MMRGPHILIRRVGLHVVVDLKVVQRVTPLFPLDDCERQFRIQDRGEGVDKRHRSVDGTEPLGREIGYRTHEQATSTAAAGRQS